jgi:hypothetical protein
MTAQLNANQQLNVNDTLVPDNNTTTLIMQGDGNLVLYRNDGHVPLWASSTAGEPVIRAVMQADGNFVCYDAAGKAYWATGTSTPGSFIVLQDDGNLVVYDSSDHPLWASNTVQSWNPMVADTGDQHLATGHWMHSWASVASDGLISGHTRTWCTIDLAGFHGSALPVIVDASDMIIWPTDPNAQKHQYGVDGVWVGTHDRTDYWANQVDAATMDKAHALQVVQYEDPKNMLLPDLNIGETTVPGLIALIEALS